jgi:chaperonin GroES
MSELQPLGDWVLAKLPKKDTGEETKTSFGLVLINDNDLDTQLLSAEVVGIGLGGTDINGARLPIDVHVGDTIWYVQHNGVAHKIDGEEHIFLNVRAGYVLAVEKGGNS